MRKPTSVAALNAFGRVRLSKTFYMRDFLYSEVATLHGFLNVPDDPDLAIEVGTRLCEELLEPIQDAFGRIPIRSAFRSREVNSFGNAQQKAGKAGYTCSDNDKNAASHIWDMTDARGKGATACIVVPAFHDRFHAPGDWRRLAWWIHDHLPYSYLEFYPINWALNVQWHEHPVRSIYSMIPGERGYLTRDTMPNWTGDHREEWAPLLPHSAAESSHVD